MMIDIVHHALDRTKGIHPGELMDSLSLLFLANIACLLLAYFFAKSYEDLDCSIPLMTAVVVLSSWAITLGLTHVGLFLLFRPQPLVKALASAFFITSSLCLVALLFIGAINALHLLPRRKPRSITPHKP